MSIRWYGVEHGERGSLGGRGARGRPAGSRERIRRLVLPAAGLLACGIGWAGCSTHVLRYKCRPPAVAVAADPLADWSCNREIMRRVIKRKRFTLREFRLAADYFETVTGIPADSRQSDHGRLPGPALERSIADWDRWLEGQRRSGGKSSVETGRQHR